MDNNKSHQNPYPYHPGYPPPNQDPYAPPPPPNQDPYAPPPPPPSQDPPPPYAYPYNAPQYAHSQHKYPPPGHAPAQAPIVYGRHSRSLSHPEQVPYQYSHAVPYPFHYGPYHQSSPYPPQSNPQSPSPYQQPGPYPPQNNQQPGPYPPQNNQQPGPYPPQNNQQPGPYPPQNNQQSGPYPPQNNQQSPSSYQQPASYTPQNNQQPPSSYQQPGSYPPQSNPQSPSSYQQQGPYAHQSNPQSPSSYQQPGSYVHQSNPQSPSSYQQPGPYAHQSNPHSFSSYQQPGQYPHENNCDRLSRQNNFSGHNRQDSMSSAPPVGMSYPLLEHQMSNMHLSGSHPSAPASPPEPSVFPLATMASTPEPQSPVYGRASSGKFYGQPNHLDRGLEEANLGRFYGQPNHLDRGLEEANLGRFYGQPNHLDRGLEEANLGRADSNDHPVLSRKDALSGPQHGQAMQIVPFHKGSLRVLLLHGNLDIWVYEAQNLPNMDIFNKTIGDMFRPKSEGKDTSDPYVTIAVAGAVIGRTYVITNNENPVWMQHFYVPVAHHAAEVHFVVKDSDILGSEIIGVVAIPVEQIYLGGKIEGSYPVLNDKGKPCKAGAVLRLSIQYTPMEGLSFYHHGVGAGPDCLGVPGTYFPLRRGGRVTLYQDAHVPDGILPNLKLDQGMGYVHGKCWVDIFDAIRQARRLIYITGWSVWHKVRLVRDAGAASDCTLGDILRSKSQEGVRVLLLVWDDPTSRSILGYKTDGIMATHDEETRRFFKHSSVQVLLCPRVAGKKHSWVKQKETGTIYTHHQKTVIVDADADAVKNSRKIIAFVGGLDLCDGRYDDPQHPILRSLDTLHKDDYHNPTYTNSTVGCPREAWHDLHSRIDGPAAYDVLMNFEERWMKAAKPRGLKKIKKPFDDALLRIERIPDIMGVNDFTSFENDPESWNIQIFRSIDSNSVKGFPKDPKDATSKNLVCGKNILIDMSIHTAYVKAIRSAEHYIYIENQYFIGSSFNWSNYKDLGADNLIPMEIALKIVSKIKANERFAAYIILPMWPEGVPSGAATQRILFWQNKTMTMMYETIFRALVEVGLDSTFSPEDYLNFYCLGNREADEPAPSSPESPKSANTPEALSRKSRRFMIYVHSKGMIVDDEFVILGSANINQRSMEGTRDTEIAMGAYQPQHTCAARHSSPLGQVYGYRMSLWAEHLGVVEDCFTRPESIDCVRRVNQMAKLNWRQFAAEEVTEMRGHLMKYPVEVNPKGKVKPLPGCETFPDVGGNIVGSFTVMQENLTI